VIAHLVAGGRTRYDAGISYMITDCEERWHVAEDYSAVSR
jgi:hypothetical protein